MIFDKLLSNLKKKFCGIFLYEREVLLYKHTYPLIFKLIKRMYIKVKRNKFIKLKLHFEIQIYFSFFLFH